MDFSTSFYKGAAGTGKTTASIKYLENLSQNTDDGILILIPQKTLATPYYEVSKKINGSPPDIFTIAGLATQMVELFWPTIGQEAGFKNPEATPVFLNLESVGTCSGLHFCLVRSRFYCRTGGIIPRGGSPSSGSALHRFRRSPSCVQSEKGSVVSRRNDTQVVPRSGESTAV